MPQLALHLFNVIDESGVQYFNYHTAHVTRDNQDQIVDAFPLRINVDNSIRVAPQPGIDIAGIYKFRIIVTDEPDIFDLGHRVVYQETLEITVVSQAN